MPQFTDHTRAQAETVIAHHLAEVEAARRVLATINGEDYSSYEGEISTLRRELSVEGEKARATLGQIAKLERKLHSAGLRIQFAETTEGALRTVAQTAREKVQSQYTEYEAECRSLRAKIQRRERRIAQQEAEIQRITAELESASKPVERGVHKSPQGPSLSADAVAVHGILEGMRPKDDKRSFDAKDVHAWLLANHNQSLSLHRIRHALGELEGYRVTKLTNTSRGAMRWIKRPVIRPAKRRTR